MDYKEKTEFRTEVKLLISKFLHFLTDKEKETIEFYMLHGFYTYAFKLMTSYLKLNRN